MGGIGQTIQGQILAPFFHARYPNLVENQTDDSGSDETIKCPETKTGGTNSFHKIFPLDCNDFSHYNNGTYVRYEVMIMDDMLNIAAAFDWITPSVAFIQDFLHGPVSDFGIPAQAGWSRRDIKRLLKDDGVRVWGLMLNLSGDMLMFTVPKSQAKQAYSLLKEAGVPLLSAPADVGR